VSHCRRDENGPPTDELLSVRRENGSAAPSGAPHPCVCPPLGGRATVEWPHGGVFPLSCTPMRRRAPATSRSPTQETHQRDLEPDHAPASGGLGTTRMARRSATGGVSRGEPG
jgi:hypothetical protein